MDLALPPVVDLVARHVGVCHVFVVRRQLTSLVRPVYLVPLNLAVIGILVGWLLVELCLHQKMSIVCELKY